MQSSNRAVFVFAFLLGVVLVAANGSSVAADSCTAQLSYPLTPTYYTSNGQIIVPLSATCAFNGGQLYAVANAVDSSGANLGSVNTLLTSTDGGNTFNGQLIFNVPPSVPSDTVQISASIYSNGPNGPLLTSTTQTVQVYSNYPTPGYYWNYAWYPTYPSYPSYTPRGHEHQDPPPPGHHDNPPWHHNDPPPSTPPHNPHH